MKRFLALWALILWLPFALATEVYGPTTARDDLWHVASLYQKQNPQTSVQQWMVAIFQENPQAFQHGNMNGLLTGFRLQIPDSQAVSQLTNQGAGHVLNRHNHAWRKGVVLTPEVHHNALGAKSGYNSSTIKAHLERLDQEVMQLNHAFAAIQNKLDGDYEKLYDESGQIQESLAALNQHVMALNLLDDASLVDEDSSFWIQVKSQWLAPNSLRVASVAAILLVLIMLWVLWTPKRSAVVVEEEVESLDLGDEYDFMHSQEGIPARLDLARAYIGMDDHESAKEVLLAILQDNPGAAYQEQAQTMLHELDQQQ